VNLPTVNVNLKPCDCQWPGERGVPHAATCRATPVHVPLPIPRSVTFQVALGECTCEAMIGSATHGAGRHADACPARPVKISCSISGSTWEESEVTDPEGHGADGRLVGFTMSSPMWQACRALWALVKALVLGWNGEAVRAVAVSGGLDLKKIDLMFQQMRTVYAALADMARAEEAHASAYSRAWGAMGEDSIPSGRRSAHWVLAHYVDRLIEQVGILNGGQ